VRCPRASPRRLQLLSLFLSLSLLAACSGRDQPAGEIRGPARSPAAIERGAQAQAEARRRVAELAASPDASAGEGQILFGDLHVHTTYSIDAFLYGLPIFAGEGAHPPADACDFARYCSSLDFFSLNDHAEGLTPERWRRTLESLRECNARAGDPADPDLVAFVGWEWTQSGTTPETHFGHKNAIFEGLADDELPARPITALSNQDLSRARHLWLVRALQALRPFGLAPYADFLWWIGRLADIPNCEEGVDTRELPPDCRENAPTPEVLFEKLAQWDLPVLVIPHGLTWGIHAPPGARLDNQLTAARRAPGVQRLLEVYSGHGSGEEFRSTPDGLRDAAGEPVCPAPTPEFLPCCWRAGEIIRERCGDLPEAECEARVREARRLALEAGRRPHWVIPDTEPEDWLDCDQCRDCFKPAMGQRPRESAQYGLAISDFDERQPDGRPARFRFGLVASSDNHTARAGSGYKQLARKGMTDARGLRSEGVESWLRPWVQGEPKDPRRAQPAPPGPMGFRNLFDTERVASFMYPGGLVAVHAAARDRRSIFDALVRREVYGTSGPRILLWFDLVNAPGGRAPMGSAVAMREAPRFEVRAVGSRVQQPGCPAESRRALGPERLERLCRSECYNPGDERVPIAAIEIVRIRPQHSPGEPVESLIEDPWRSFPCDGGPRGCVVRFSDPEFPAAGRDAVYYARALQEPTPAVNGANLRTTFDSDGRAVAVRPCFGGWRTPADDDCLAPVQERAWSSPVFVDFSASPP
jgi:hypothetical protein